MESNSIKQSLSLVVCHQRNSCASSEVFRQVSFKSIWIISGKFEIPDKHHGQRYYAPQLSNRRDQS